VRVRSDLWIEVWDASPWEPRKRVANKQSTGGRGLELLELSAPGYTVDYGAIGKTRPVGPDGDDTSGAPLLPAAGRFVPKARDDARTRRPGMPFSGVGRFVALPCPGSAHRCSPRSCTARQQSRWSGAILRHSTYMPSIPRVVEMRSSVSSSPAAMFSRSVTSYSKRM
jgi:hypothetical protein